MKQNNFTSLRAACDEAIQAPPPTPPQKERGDGLLLKFAMTALSVVILLSGCKTTHQPAAVALAKMRKEDRIESIQQQSIPFNTLSSSLRFSIQPGKKKNTTSTNAQLRIIKDQTIQISLRIPILGTEVARATFTPEQVILIDRIHKRYFSQSMQAFKEKTSFDFDFYSLQALFTNQLFIAGKPSVTPNDYNTFQWNENQYLFTLNNTDKQGVHYDFTGDFTQRIIQTEMYKNKDDVNLNWQYKDFGLTSNNRLFPMKMTMELTIPNDLITMNLLFNNVDINTDFELNTSVPNDYQPVTMEDIIKLIQSF
jgi:hypothetical protein